MKKITLQQIADKEGVTRQAIWARTPKGLKYIKAYVKAYRKTEKSKAYHRNYYLAVTKVRKGWRKYIEESRKHGWIA